MGRSLYRPVGWTPEEGGGDVCGFITMCSDIGGMPSVGVPGKGAQPGKALLRLHVQALEVKVGYNTGNTNTTTTVP